MGDESSPLVDRVTALAFSADGRWLASGGGEPSRGGEIKIWDVQERRLMADLPEIHSDTVLSLAFSPDGKYLASGAADKFARVVEWEREKLARTFEGHTHHVTGVAWKADGRTLATSGADNVVKVWDFVKGDRKKTIQGFDKEITSIQFVGVGDEAVVSSGDNRVRMIKEDGKTVRDFGGIQSFQHAAAATPDGSVVIGGGEDSVLRVWNGNKGDLIASFESSVEGLSAAK
jgi:WD40 repeat protein